MAVAGRTVWGESDATSSPVSVIKSVVEGPPRARSAPPAVLSAASPAPEAELLMRAYRHHPHIPLPVTSTRLSRVMIRTADAIEAELEEMSREHDDLVRQLVIDHLPPVLVEIAGDRLWQQTPAAYLRWIMAKSLAARIVYREGVEYLAAMAPEGKTMY